MSRLDLCCILGNLFDNAIEASMALPERDRLIRVYMDMKGTQLRYFLHKLHRRKEARKRPAGASAPRRARGTAWSRAHRRYRRAAGRVSLPQQREDGAFTTEILLRRCERNGSSPKICHSSPVCAGTKFVIVLSSQRRGGFDERKTKKPRYRLGQNMLGCCGRRTRHTGTMCRYSLSQKRSPWRAQAFWFCRAPEIVRCVEEGGGLFRVFSRRSPCSPGCCSCSAVSAYLEHAPMFRASRCAPCAHPQDPL